MTNDRAIKVVASKQSGLAEVSVEDAAVVVAALLADPFDRDARTEARLWLRAWMAAHTDRRSTTPTGAGATVTLTREGGR